MLALLGLALATAAAALEVDDHTLFLCTFDRGAAADFSLGSPYPDGVAAFTAGSSGDALSAPFGLLPFAEAVAPITTGLQYDTAGNLSLQQGTIELSVRVYGEVVQTTEQSPKLRYLMSSGRFVGENHGFALLLSHFDGAVGTPYQLVWTRGNGAAPAKNWSLATAPQWRRGEWHRVTVTWSSEADVMYVDGIEVGKISTGEGMDLVADKFAIGANIYHGHVADCALDDLRILDCVRAPAR